MTTLGTILTVALAILAIATAAGFGLQRGRVSQLQGRLDDSDKEVVRKDRRLTDALAELETVKAQLEALRQVVTGEVQLEVLTEKLDEHHEEAQTHWNRDEKLLEEIRDRLPARSP